MPDFSARDPRLDTNAETTPAQAGSVHPAARSAMQRTQPRRASRLRNSFTAEDITDEDLAPPAPAVSDAPGFTAANMRSDDGPGRLSSTDGTEFMTIYNEPEAARAQHVEYADEEELPDADTVGVDGSGERRRSGSITPTPPVRTSPVRSLSSSPPQGSGPASKDDNLGFADFYPHFVDICEHHFPNLFEVADVDSRIFGKGKMKQGTHHPSITKAVVAIGKLKDFVEGVRSGRITWSSLAELDYAHKDANDPLDVDRRDSAKEISPTKNEGAVGAPWTREEQEAADIQRAIEASLKDGTADHDEGSSSNAVPCQAGPLEHGSNNDFTEQSTMSLTETSDDSSVNGERGSSPSSQMSDVADDFAALTVVKNGSFAAGTHQHNPDAPSNADTQDENVDGPHVRFQLMPRPKRKSMELGDAPMVDIEAKMPDADHDSPPGSPNKKPRHSSSPSPDSDFPPLRRMPSRRHPAPPSDADVPVLHGIPPPGFTEDFMDLDTSTSGAELRNSMTATRMIDDVIFCMCHLWKAYLQFAFATVGTFDPSFNPEQAKAILDLFSETGDLWPLLSLSKSRINAVALSVNQRWDISNGLAREPLSLDDLRDKVYDVVWGWWDSDLCCYVLSSELLR